MGKEMSDIIYLFKKYISSRLKVSEGDVKEITYCHLS